jgi:hypothetical protein
MRYRIEFRYIPPYDYMTPLMHIPKQITIVEANDVPAAISVFKEYLVGNLNFDHFHIESIEQI